MESNNNKKGSVKKVLIGALIGLMFGVFAAVGFVAVNMAVNMVGGDAKAGTLFVQKDDSQTEQVADAKQETEAEEVSDEKDTKTPQEVLEDVEKEVYDKIPKVESPKDQGVYVTDVTEVVKAVMPAVVSVNSKYVETMEYFGQVYSQDSEGAGSGIIVGQNDTELLIVTNHHVVDDAEELMVTFSDTDTAPALIKGTDEEKDLAIIAVSLSEIDSRTMEDIAVASLGDSDALIVGEPVVAIGNALGYGQSVTTGVVSALNRVKQPLSYYSENEQSEDEQCAFIQTDAAINPGNSGGALLNMKGEVIGINSSKIGGNVIEGMGYAIPISDAKPIIRELMTKNTKKKVEEGTQGYLGITGLTVEKDYSDAYGMPMGVFISSVNEGSGADKAGLIRGDIITEFDGESVNSMEELKSLMTYYGVGDTVDITIMQGSPTGYQPKTVTVTLGKAPEQ